MNRRHLLSLVPAAALAQSASKRGIHLATNTYPWITFSKRAGEKFQTHSDELLAKISSTGLKGYEPIINSTDEFKGLGKRLKKHGLEMRSLYVNSVLHDPDAIKKSIFSVLAIAREAQKLGTSLIVTNPSPIKWGSPESKSDAQLKLQAEGLDILGSSLKAEGLTLAYHNHDMELRHGAREFHHMLTTTSPEHVKFCLDAHWIYRGCGNSQVALFDTLSHYADRIVELHLRQSIEGIWTETFTKEGDIDYQRLFTFLTAKKIAPHFVLEQAVEEKTSNNLTAVEAHQQSRVNFFF